jgi:CHAT domain-containing protein
LVRLEGPNLTLERLNGADFGRADLVHLASHAVIDRAYPEFSYIRLSGRGEHGPEMLTPADLRGRRITAQLAVLSACSTVGLNRFEYDTHLGFVSEFLQRGASLVLASLWPIPDRATVPLMADFYLEAKRTPNLAQALRATKLRAATAPGASPGHWAAFQLFSR